MYQIISGGVKSRNLFFLNLGCTNSGTLYHWWYTKSGGVYKNMGMYLNTLYHWWYTKSGGMYKNMGMYLNTYRDAATKIDPAKKPILFWNFVLEVIKSV
jgi:hypothetical protein